MSTVIDSGRYKFLVIQLDSNKHNALLHFRPDIEGMRAIAIALVVADHAGVSELSGGFIGVDVFFVLSGYLITGLIVKELEAKGRVSLTKFYARRLKRLLPALFLMVTIVCAVSLFLLAPFEHDNHAISAISAVAWVSNMYFALANFGYFDPNAESNLFLHTWSLGVEEQFYLVWPALLIFLAKTFRSNNENLSSLLFAKGLLILFLVGLLFSLLMFAFKPVWSFYFLPSRAWQFAAGALAFLSLPVWQQKRVSRYSNAINIFGSFLGLSCIVLAALAFHESTPYPGYRALLPTIGAVLMLVCVNRDHNQHAVTRMLSIPIMQWFGKISYSWYLWHWPVLLLGTTLSGNHGIEIIAPLVLISLGCAVASYYLVESPVRYSKLLADRYVMTITGSIAIAVLLVGTGAGWIERSEAWSKLPGQKEFRQSQLDVARIYGDGCDAWYSSVNLKPCVYGNRDATKTAVLIGDSIGAQWFPALHEMFTTRDWNLILLTKGSCPIIDETYFYDDLNRPFIECNIWRDAAIDWIMKQSPDMLFIGNSQVDFTEQQWVEGTKRVLKRVTGAIPSVFVIRPTYTLPFHGPACLARYQWQSHLISPLIECIVRAGNESSELVLDWLGSAIDQSPGAKLIDMNALICPKGECRASINGIAVFRDHSHITASFSRSLHRYFEKYAFPD